MIKKVFIGFFILLSICIIAAETSHEPIGAKEETFAATDDYVFEGKEFEHADFRLKVVIIPDQKKFDELRAKLNPNANDIQAFSSINTLNNTCTIYIKDPTWQYTPEKIGHEIAHCVWGRWHNERDQRETALKGQPV